MKPRVGANVPTAAIVATICWPGVTRLPVMSSTSPMYCCVPSIGDAMPQFTLTVGPMGMLVLKFVVSGVLSSASARAWCEPSPS
ncbi:MAG TPA: hypothetical protein VF698_05895 [Thermoanaerobaculia bacterium]|jgi:hypothetical protein